MVYFSPITVINSKKHQEKVLALLSLYVEPQSVGGNAGVLFVFPDFREKDVILKPVLFAALNTTDKSNQKMEIFEDQDNQKIGSSKEIMDVIKQVSATNPVEIFISRKVETKIELGMCK